MTRIAAIMINQSRILFLFLAGVIAATGGCSGEKPVGDIVQGTVNLDGKPLEKGRVNVVPTDNVGAGVGAEIVNGKFELRIKPGPKLVQITSDKFVGKQKVYPDDPQSTTVDKFEQILPDKYNKATELKMDVKAGGKTQVKFDLESAAPAQPAK